jgi:hypothetical protein
MGISIPRTQALVKVDLDRALLLLISNGAVHNRFTDWSSTKRTVCTFLDGLEDRFRFAQCCSDDLLAEDVLSCASSRDDDLMMPAGRGRDHDAIDVWLRQAIDALPDTLIGKRDHAALVIGFAGAFRRSEPVALSMEDIQTTGEGLIITLRRSKTDQEGQTMVRGLPKGTSEATCPYATMR